MSSDVQISGLEDKWMVKLITEAADIREVVNYWWKVNVSSLSLMCLDTSKRSSVGSWMYGLKKVLKMVLGR